MPRVLQAVALVQRRHEAVESLPHIGELVSSFLGPPPTLSLHGACRFGSTDLMDWIWACSSDFLKNRRPGWSLCHFLCSDSHYYQRQFSKCVAFAAEKENLQLLTWLFSHFTDCTVSDRVVSHAAEKGRLATLQFLLTHDYGHHGSYETEAADVDVRSRNSVNWGPRLVENTLRNGHSEVARWLYQHAPKSEYDLGEDAIEGMVREALNVGEMDFAASVVPAGRNVLDYARDCECPEVLERLVEGGYFLRENFSASSAIAKLAKTDRLDLIERISVQQNLPPDHSEFWGMDWHQALSAACRTGNMRVLRWLVEHPMGLEIIDEMEADGSLHGLLCRAAENGHVQVMEYLYDEGIIGKFGAALFFAIRSSQLRSVKWLVEHFPDSEPLPSYSVMNEAAKLGRLEILQLLQSMDESVVPGWTFDAPSNSEALDRILVTATDSNLKVQKGAFINISKPRPTDPMDHAAANGHLDVVKWFHVHRREGCSAAAISSAAANGYLDVVKWLGATRSEVCTTKSMNGAASRGNLEMLKWLHTNMTTGCTADAMDFAAWSGHLKALEWLHTNRREGCTAKAIENAVTNGHLKVASWLQLHYPQFAPAKLSKNCFPANTFEVLLLARAHYAYLLTREFIQGILQNCRHGSNAEIAAWLRENYPEDCVMEMINRRGH